MENKCRIILNFIMVSGPGGMKRISMLVYVLAAFSSSAQNYRIDTVQQLEDIEVSAYFDPQPLQRSTATVGIIDSKKLSEWHDYSLVPSLNSVPGVRMEERSPGSYRLSIRGSLLRSPFGIRNIKVYLDDFPLTDAGGNTYLNLLDAGTINRIEILRGPEASIFGANSNGVVLINPVSRTRDSSFVSFGASAGSYGTSHQKLIFQQNFNRYRINAAGGVQHSDGYRQNSESSRQYIQLFQQWNFAPNIQHKAFLMYSNLDYRTPGGLTRQQFENTPRAARYPTATLPGAVEQKAGIKNQTVFGGLAQDIYFTPTFKHSLAIFGSHTDFANPFITNYEVRTENSAGLRTYFELGNNPLAHTSIKWQTGLEAQRTRSEINNFGNRQGSRDTIQASDDIVAGQYFYFTRFSVYAFKRLTVEAALSLNHYEYYYRNLLQSMDPIYNHKRFAPQLMPRLAMAYQLSSVFTYRASVSRGYSAPTIAEIRPSDNVVYTNLQPEQGWNYETGIRVQNRKTRTTLDVAVFYYRLQNAIVRRTTEEGTEYFVNAGGTKQWGVETQFSTWIIKPRASSVIRGMQFWDSYTFSHFTFSNYSNAASDFSGKDLTGVPRNVNVAGVNTQLPMNFYLLAQYNYTSPIPLNDINAAYANEYHLVQMKSGWKKWIRNTTLELFAGIDNLLNQSYSLGNDLNAAAGRYYNPAPPRNYFGGLNVTF